MNPQESIRGRAVVVQPGTGPSYWQPVPANGHADPALFPASTGFDGLSMGFQSVAPGGRIREHSHGEQVELQICFRGRGRVVVDGATHRAGARHRVLPRLRRQARDHQRGRGRSRDALGRDAARAREVLRGDRAAARAGQAPPAPFERPRDVVAIERALGMNDTVR